MAKGLRAASHCCCADDFVFLAILIGNDYVPGLTSYLFEPTWENYRRLKLSKPATRTEFVFDATTKVVNWALVQSINGGLDFSSAGASEASKPNAQAHVSATAEHDDDAVVSARNATFGRLHPKSVVCELLMLGGDMPVFEGNKTRGFGGDARAHARFVAHRCAVFGRAGGHEDSSFDVEQGRLGGLWIRYLSTRRAD